MPSVMQNFNRNTDAGRAQPLASNEVVRALGLIGSCSAFLYIREWQMDASLYHIAESEVFQSLDAVMHAD